MILAILVLLTALSISAVAIYYSVAGLVAIFAAAALPIMIMGGVLEVGKLVTAVWLHKYWNQARWWLKGYLSVAVVVLMFITSMGIFGFLSKAHIEQTASAEEGIAQLERIDEDVIRLGAVIERAELRIEEAEASVGLGNTAIQEQIDKEQTRIDTAYDRIQPAIDEQNAIIQTQLNSLEDRVAVYTDEIIRLNTEKQRLEDLVSQYRTELANTDVASIEAQIKPYTDQITQLDADLERINTQANEYEQRINEVNIDTSAVEALQQQIADIEETIVVTTNKLQSTEQAKIQEGQATIGVTSDGLFGGNTRRALATWVEAQQTRIQGLQSQAVELRTQAQSTLDAERSRLTDIVTELRGPQSDQINQRKQSLLDAIDQVRGNSVDEAKTERARIQQRIDGVITNDIPNTTIAVKTAQDAITQLRQAEDPRIIAARQAIADLRLSADSQISASNDLIQRLRDNLTVGSDPQVEAVVQQQQQKIIEANNSIDTLTENKYTLQAEYRKLEAEVGPVKYLAEFIYGETADQDLLEEAVRWVILIIIFVFDPLAVLLLIASQATFEMRKKERNKSGYEEKIDDNTNRLDDGQQVKEAGRETSTSTGTSEQSSTVTEGAESDDKSDGAGREGRSSTDRVFESNEIESKKKDIELSEELKVAERNALYLLKEKDESYRNSKTNWKNTHPKETIKFYKTLYIQGKIDKLPWEDNYQQNAEQDETSLFQKIQKSRDNE